MIPEFRQSYRVATWLRRSDHLDEMLEVARSRSSQPIEHANKDRQIETLKYLVSRGEQRGCPDALDN
jgi:hypothetical protein